MKSYKEQLIDFYKEHYNTEDIKLEKYKNITEENAENLLRSAKDHLRGRDNNIRLYRDGAFIGYASNESQVIKHVMG